MNRETLDGIVKQALYAHATSLLIDIGKYINDADKETAVIAIREREQALDIVQNDAKRAAVVDVLFKEMNS